MISKEENVIVFEDGSSIPKEELAVVFSVRSNCFMAYGYDNFGASQLIMIIIIL